MRVSETVTPAESAAHAEAVEEAVPAFARYSITPTDADMLLGAAMVPGELRAFLLRQYADNHGTEALIGLFGEFIGLTHRLAAAAEEAATVILITEGLDPHEAERVNTPTLMGALQGIMLADGVDRSKTCGGCAFRLGTVANMSPCTTADAADCVPASGSMFMCHENMDEKGKPTKACAGWAQARNKERNTHD